MTEIKDTTTTKFLECSCKDNSHLIVLKSESWDGIPGESPELYVSYQLNHYLPWYKRIVHAVRFVLGFGLKQSSWDTTILSEKHVKDIEDLLKEHRKNQKKAERTLKASTKIRLPKVVLKKE